MEFVCALLSFFNLVLLLFLLLKKEKTGFSGSEKAVIMQNSKIDEKAMERIGISIEELMSSARLAGFFNLGDIDTAILEPCGKISFLPVPMKRRLTPKDFNFAPVREGMCRIIISDGKIIRENLLISGISEEALFELLAQRENKLEDILLAIANEEGRVDFFEK